MSKKKKPVMGNQDHYDYIRAVVDCGELNLTYKLFGSFESNMAHEEDVSDFSHRDIEKLVRGLLSVEADDPVKIEVDFV